MKITFSKINTIKNEIEVKANSYKSVYFDIESARTDGVKIDPKVFTSLDKIKIGTSKTNPTFTDIQASAFADLVKNASFVEVSVEDLYDYLASKADNTKDNPYKIKIITSTTGASIIGTNYSNNTVEGTIQHALIKNANKYVDLIISDSFNTIGLYAFYGCTSLTSVIISDSVTSIDICAFADCDSLTSVTIPSSVTSIGDGAFRDCDSLTSLAVPDSVNSINSYLFSYCTSLTSVTIPDSATSIGNGAFYACISLKTINYTGTEEQWNAIKFGNEWNFKVISSLVINYNYQG